MNWLFIALSSCSTGAAIWWALKMRAKAIKVQRRYAHVVDIDDYVATEKRQIEEYKGTEKDRLQRFIQEQLDSLEEEKDAATNELNTIKKKIEQAEIQSEAALSRISNDREELAKSCSALRQEKSDIEKQIKLFRESEASLLSEVGYYERAYEFEDFPSFKNELDRIREQRKKLLKLDIDEPGAAVYRKGNWNLNLPAREAKSFQKKVSKLMLRAFNGECDSFVARVNYKNVKLMRDRITSSHGVINKTVYKQFMTKISIPYRDLWTQELSLVFEFEEWKQREKEEQARIREQIREEERAAKELEKAKREAELEAQRNADALQKARSEVDGANEKQKARLLAQIEELEKRMAEMEEKNRYISQAMLTKTGHVYIISNVGSFGDNMFKIGMTRRLEPMDRVKELGDASVPFPFDVHAMIRTSDAPSLENALHKHFDDRRVNLENNRKEFFYVTIQEIQKELDVLKGELNIEADIHITMAAEAKQWRISEAKRKHLERSFQVASTESLQDAA